MTHDVTTYQCHCQRYIAAERHMLVNEASLLLPASPCPAQQSPLSPCGCAARPPAPRRASCRRPRILRGPQWVTRTPPAPPAPASAHDAGRRSPHATPTARRCGRKLARLADRMPGLARPMQGGAIFCFSPWAGGSMTTPSLFDAVEAPHTWRGADLYKYTALMKRKRMDELGTATAGSLGRFGTRRRSHRKEHVDSCGLILVCGNSTASQRTLYGN